jgi:hypothetical protein
VAISSTHEEILGINGREALIDPDLRFINAEGVSALMDLRFVGCWNESFSLYQLS